MESVTHIWNLTVVHTLMLALQWLADFASAVGSLIGIPLGGGVAIILMTIIIKSLLLPLSIKQTNSMKRMQSIQPEIAALKKRVKDKEKLTQETMQLYKERGVNPAAGCLPMLPMMVVLIGLYGALINLAQCDVNRDIVLSCDHRFAEPFLWVPRLDLPDAFHIDALGFGLPGILPIAMAITQYFSSKMMAMPSQDPQQAQMNRMMTIMMPGMMLFWGITFPAGLVLYWLVSNVYEMVRLYFTMGPQSLMGAPSGAGSGLGGLSFGSLFGRSRPSDEGSTTEAIEVKTTGDISGDGTRVNGRPTRTRQKRGRRSGRR